MYWCTEGLEKPTNLNASFPLWNMDDSPSWFGGQCQPLVPDSWGYVKNVAYRNVLEHAMIPSAQQLFPTDQEWMLQQGNVSCHTARTVRHWLNDHDVNILPRPIQSPDMNPIENMWNFESKSNPENKPGNIKELKHVLKQKWPKIDPELCQKCLFSMTSCVKVLLKTKGWPTKY